MTSFFKNWGDDYRTEIRAGVTTFLTAAYIIIVNAQILSSTGMDRSAIVTATCVTTAIATLLMGLWCRVPFMMAPGMGLNTFFAYTLCLGKGVPWQTALGIVFLSATGFLILSLVGFRERVLRAIPISLRHAIPVGIGLFLTFIGLQNSGLIIKNEATLVTIGHLSGGESITTWIALLGLLLAAALSLKGVKGALLITIAVTTTVGVLFGVSELPNQFFSWPAPLTPTLFKLDLMNAMQLVFLPSIFTFMFINLFDSIGTLLGLSEKTQTITAKGEIPRLNRMLTSDAIASMLGAVLGTSTVTAYIESASGVAAGGRSGLTAVVTALCFLLALFCTPLAIFIPAYAVAPALIFVGFLMMSEIRKIDWQETTTALPAFLVIVGMPLTYSIANGILLGFTGYLVMHLLAGKWRQLHWLTVVIALLCLANLLFLH